MVDINRHLGMETENRFFYAMQSLPKEMRPLWLWSIQEASRAEDTIGYDGFVRLDVGTIGIQIKSSMTGAQRYLEEYPNRRILVVVVAPDSTEVEIREAVIGALENWRTESLVSMRRWKPQWSSLFSQKVPS